MCISVKYTYCKNAFFAGVIVPVVNLFQTPSNSVKIVITKHPVQYGDRN